jgi:Glycosyltransferase Family 4
MRIAQIAPLYESVPPKLYGGTERVVSYLTEELVELGHEVTLFASGDSQTSARLVAACDRALWRDPDCRETLPHHVRLMDLVFREARKFDILHFHCDYVHFPLVDRGDVPAVTTLHGRVNPHDVGALFDQYPATALVSISDDQRRPLPEANWRATVVDSIEEAVEAVGEAGYLNREACRLAFEQRFDARRMARDYVRVYSGLMQQQSTSRRFPVQAVSEEKETTAWSSLAHA